MAARYDEDRPNVATGAGRVPAKKSKSKPARKPSSSKPKPKVASRPAAPAVTPYGVGPDTPLDAPLTAQQGYAMANAAADRAYLPQINAVKGLQTSAPVWYQDYLNRNVATQQAAQAYAQPLLDQSRAAVQNVSTGTPGLDPGSAQYAKDQQAAQGRASIAQLGADSLAAVPVATNAYFAGQQTTAARELPQTLAGYGQQLGQLGSQRAQAVSDEYGQIRTGEQNAGIARETLGLNTQKAAADVDISRGVDPVTGKPLPGKPKTASERKTEADLKYFEEHGYYPTTGPQAPKKSEDQKKAEQAAKDLKTKRASIKKSTGRIKGRVTDARDAWERYAAARNPATKYDPDRGENVPDIDPVTKKQKTIKATPDQIKARLRKDKYTEAEIHAMLVLRAGKTLTPSDIQRLKDQDPNFRVPAEWRPKRSRTPAQDKAPHAVAGKPERASGYGGSF